MPLNHMGITGQSDVSVEVLNDISVVAINWFANRNPLITRLPRLVVGLDTFTITARDYRPRSYTLNAAVANNTVGTVTFVDATPLLVGDVLELASGERVEVSSDPPANNVVSVTRGIEGTTAAAQSNATTATLIGNSRTGKEVDQTASARTPTAVTQYVQTFQHPVQVGGKLQASTNWIGSEGARTPLDRNRMDAIQNLMDDIEVTSYLGKGDDGTTTGRKKQKGLKTLIASANVVTSPVNASAYKAVDLVRDAFQAPRSSGGSPDVLLVSSQFMTGFATWGHSLQRFDAGQTVYGTPIDVFEAPFLRSVTVIECPLMPAYTCVALTSAEVRMRFIRNEFWNPRGIRGDAWEGDMIGDFAIEVDNPAHHAWVQGITAFSA